LSTPGITITNSAEKHNSHPENKKRKKRIQRNAMARKNECILPSATNQTGKKQLAI
jgi:hypothetical protein